MLETRLAVWPGEEAVVPDAMKAAWQGVEKEASDELSGFERQGAMPGSAFAAIVLDAEGDAPPVERDDAPGGDGDAVGVTRQIGEHGLGSCEGRLGVDDPSFAPDRSEMAGEGLRFGQMCQHAVEGELAGVDESGEPFEEQTAEQCAQHTHRQQEGGTRGDPVRSTERDAAARHDHMEVRMVGHRRAPGVKDGGKADAGAEVLRVGGDLRHGLGGCPEQEVVDGSLVLEGDCRDLGRQREDDVEVSDRQKVGLTLCEPVARRSTLAPWAVPVAAGVIGDAQMATLVTALDMAAERSGAAVLDR